MWINLTAFWEFLRVSCWSRFHQLNCFCRMYLFLTDANSIFFDPQEVRRLPVEVAWLPKLNVGAIQGVTPRWSLGAGLRWNGERMRKWRENEEMKRKWRENEEIERLPFYISSFSLHFLPLSPFPTSKFVTFCRKMLNTALLSRMSQKS